MDSTIITLITAIIGAVGGIITKHFLDGWKEQRQGKKNEAQKLATERDHFRRMKLQWRDTTYQTRAVALDHGVPPDKLPDTPDD